MSGEDFVKYLQEISILNFIHELRFENDDDFFYDTPIHRHLMTDEGICYTINAEKNEKLFTPEIADYLIKFENLRESFKLPKDYPVHTSKSGSEYGLKISTENLVDNFNGMCTEKDGFKVMLHSPHTYPQMSTHYIDIPADELIMIAIKPVVITTSENLRKYNPKIRHCYFDNEKNLQFFRQYSQSNCEYECFIQRLMMACKCVAFYMPHVNNTRICQSSEEKLCHCEFRDNYGQLKDCDCLPSCNSITYDTEITSSKNEDKDSNVEHVSVYFKKDYFLKIKRIEVFGWASFFSSIGGFLGLLMGGSVLSVIELLYNIFIRHCFEKKNDEGKKIIKEETKQEDLNENMKNVKRKRTTNSCRF